MSAELLIPVFGTKFAKGWPKYEQGDPAVYMPISRAMSIRHRTDAHFAAYALPSEKRRLAGDAIFERLPDGFAMCLFAVDVDGPDHAVTDEWWRGERVKIERLFKKHPGAFLFRTRGGYRLIYLLARPVTLKSVHDKERWKRRYVAWIAYLKREFAIAGDDACKGPRMEKSIE